VPELVKFDLATPRTSQLAEHGVDAHLSPAAIAVHVYFPPLPGGARWTGRVHPLRCGRQPCIMHDAREAGKTLCTGVRDQVTGVTKTAALPCYV